MWTHLVKQAGETPVGGQVGLGLEGTVVEIGAGGVGWRGAGGLASCLHQVPAQGCPRHQASNAICLSLVTQSSCMSPPPPPTWPQCHPPGHLEEQHRVLALVGAGRRHHAGDTRQVGAGGCGGSTVVQLKGFFLIVHNFSKI